MAELAEHVARLSQEVAYLQRVKPAGEPGLRYKGEEREAVHMTSANYNRHLLRQAIADLSDVDLSRALNGHSEFLPSLDGVDSDDVRRFARAEVLRRARVITDPEVTGE